MPRVTPSTRRAIRRRPAFLVTAGRLDIIRHDALDRQSLVIAHGVGQISGEVSQLAGRPSMVECRAGPEGCEVAPFDAAHLRALVVGSADIGEIIMRAFILRRTSFISEGVAGSVLVGRAGDPRLVRLQGFLSRNGYPHATLDPASDPDAATLVERFALHAEDLPIALCPNGQVLKRPDEAQLGACLGITPTLDPEKLYDVAVVRCRAGGGWRRRCMRLPKVCRCSCWIRGRLAARRARRPGSRIISAFPRAFPGSR